MDGRDQEQGGVSHISSTVTQDMTTVLRSLDPAFWEAREDADRVKSQRGTEGLGSPQTGQLDHTEESGPRPGENALPPRPGLGAD